MSSAIRPLSSKGADPDRQLLADIAANLGYEVVGIDSFCTRSATATKQQMREEVVVLALAGHP